MQDLDPVETQEWLDALESVIDKEGEDRAHYLMTRMGELATRSGSQLPYAITTPYRNTIPVTHEARMPGDLFMERRIRSMVRWNALAMVMRTNLKDSDLGGHISSFASSATLYDIGFNYFFQAPTEEHGGDLIFYQGHASPGIYARAFLEGRISEDQMNNFRQEVDGNGLSSYPHPWLMPDFWQFPTVSMGLGPIQAIYQARFMKYLEARGFIPAGKQKVWCFMGDGECDEPESLGAISLAGREKLDNLIFAITTDASVRMQKLKKGECQVTLFPRPADIEPLKADKSLQMPHQAGFNLGYIAYNVMDKVKGSNEPNPLAKLEVRQALDMAVDKQKIIESVYQGAGQLAVNAMPPTQWSYDDSIQGTPYDPEKAKALLKEAGIKEGTEITLWAMPVQRPYNPNARLMAEMLQSDWAKIGIKAKIVSYEWGEYIKRSKGGEQGAMLIGWSGDNGDPDNWLGTLYGCDAIDGNNFSKWCYKPYDDLIKQAKATSDQAKRTELYQKAQHILKEQVPITPIAHSTVYQPMSAKVEGFKISPFSLNSFYGVGIRK